MLLPAVEIIDLDRSSYIAGLTLNVLKYRCLKGWGFIHPIFIIFGGKIFLCSTLIFQRHGPRHLCLCGMIRFEFLQVSDIRIGGVRQTLEINADFILIFYYTSDSRPARI